MFLFTSIACFWLYRAIEEHISKISAMPSCEDELQELEELLLINLNFHKERKLLSQAFLCPQKGFLLHLLSSL